MVYVYQFETTTNATTEASVHGACLAILDRQDKADLTVWTVAVTEEQALAFRRIVWVIAPRQRGVMQLEDEEYVYRDRKTGEVLSVSVESLSP